MERWPSLRFADWAETQTTLHLWTQIVGKIRLRLTPLVNHWWNVTLYVTPRGLTTGPMPYADGRLLSIAFDFFDHELRLEDSDGSRRGFALEPMSVSAFYERTMRELRDIGVRVDVNVHPNEVADAVPFPRDTMHAAYDARAVERFFAVLTQAHRLCSAFRSGFIGKASPVHFFWGSFDLAETRFSGRPAPPHPGGFPNMPDDATREAYSREEHSIGFWPGGPSADALFYAYAYPEPQGFKDARVRPAEAYWLEALREFVLPYDTVRNEENRDGAVLEFFESTYDAAASLARWDRSLLER